MKKLIKKVLMTLISLFKWEKKIPIVSIKESSNLLEGKVALITGGSGGIGMAIAKSLLESGCKVIIAGTNEQKLKKSIEILQNDAKYVILNMNDISSFRDKINSVVSTFGHIELFVNSAGVHSDANSTSKCKITKCLCKSTPLVLRNSISFLVSH